MCCIPFSPCKICLCRLSSHPWSTPISWAVSLLLASELWVCLTLSKIPWHCGWVEVSFSFYYLVSPVISYCSSMSPAQLWGMWLVNEGKIFKLEQECHPSCASWKKGKGGKEAGFKNKVFVTSPCVWLTLSPHNLAWCLTWRLAQWPTQMSPEWTNEGSSIG